VILFIHGFGSHGFGSKAKAMRTWCNQHNIPFLAPSLSSVPDLALQTLRELIVTLTPNTPVGLVGSSLGGFYAARLAQEFKLPVVLINPSPYAEQTLTRAYGQGINFYDDSQFEWNEKHTGMLAANAPELPAEFNDSQCWLLVQTGDELLDYKEALRACPNARHTVIEGGDHGFQGFEEYIPEIADFLLNR